METNPNALVTTQRNTIFTNVAETSDGGFYWEGLEKEVDTSKVEVTSWLGEKWTPDCGKPAAHPNSRYIIHSCVFHCCLVGQQVNRAMLHFVL